MTPRFAVPASRLVRALAVTRRAAFALVALLAVALLALAMLAPGRALAQDPRASAAQLAAREWLKLTDQDGGGAAAWKAASPRFQSTMPMLQWTVMLKRQRDPRGAVLQRTIESTSFGTKTPGLPEGNYATVSFRSSFAKETSAVEQVTLEQGSDGAWRVIGYMVR